MSNSTLHSYYQTIFSLAQHHKWSLSDIEGLIPFERDLYVQMLKDYISLRKKENINPGEGIDVSSMSEQQITDMVKVAALNKERMMQAMGDKDSGTAKKGSRRN